MGSISLPNLKTISAYFGVNIEGLGSGSLIDLSSLKSIDGASSASPAAKVLDGNLTTLNGVAVNLDGTGTIQTSQWVSLTNGSLTISGDYSSTTSPAFASLSNIDGSEISAEGGSLVLPAVSFISIVSSNYGETSLQAGEYENGSLLATGTLSLPDLTEISTFGNPVLLTAAGNGSAIDLPN